MAAVAAVTLLATAGLRRDFGGLRAVDNVDFALEQGEIRAIIGPNGAGKTTFVSLICGRVRPIGGRIVFEGADITNLPAHERVNRGIAYTFQITSVYGNLSAFDNIALAAQSSIEKRFRGAVAVVDVARRTGEALERVGLADRRNVRAGDLAYGHQRLLEVAMGLALAPKLLILDEPTQGLSDSEIAGFCDLIRAIAAETTVLLIEHNMAVVMALAGKITVMNAGKILAEGSPEAVRADEAVQRAYLGG
ncbi:MAG: ABC transporter ATP-binding protein [Pseudomonadota bacterium]|nr:ABC transporter ATP-binding protein [Pseudomonadota bacterium]